jgi:hypothetical protein
MLNTYSGRWKSAPTPCRAKQLSTTVRPLDGYPKLGGVPGGGDFVTVSGDGSQRRMRPTVVPIARVTAPRGWEERCGGRSVMGA